MAKHWSVEVLTTCARDYVRWENFYPAGEDRVDQVLIRRFSVDAPRDVEHFDKLSSELVSRNGGTLAEQETWMLAQGPISTPLFEYLRSTGDDYDAFIFFGYLYATTYFGLPLVQEKAWLAPLGHDEWPIHLSMWDKFFAKPRGFVFQTHEELNFLQERFRGLPLNGPIAGIGIERPDRLDPENFRAAYNLDTPFLLYAGRIEAAKGCAEMFDWFTSRHSSVLPRHKLVIMGREVLAVPFHDDIIYLGFVSDEEKWNAMAACDWMLLPSRYESLSISLLETWAAGRPGLVNGKSEVLKGHCQRSHGGLWYNEWDECDAILRLVDNETKTILGKQGRDYVSQVYSWERVERDYLRAIGTALSSHLVSKA